MTSSTSTVRARGPVVGFLVLLWVVGLLALAWWWFALGMQQWAASYSGSGPETEQLRRQVSQVLMIMLVVAAAGPAVIALVAYRLRLVRTAIVFLVLALALGVPGLPLAAHAYRDSTPPPPPPASVPGCHELSGGDTRCPGG
ncbi:DUF6234 family protein [Micromonospora yasonensis]|uniref:DUF6234 family protein n=1 Tax=Micromonospora yasonensis TaxID=1128667 RepID=UPI002231F980|nr:DUF6234 family protein [Micromonospora yasonensis]MCW3843183.1 DUF6234 family protein [Micromonospora yasonensis]